MFHGTGSAQKGSNMNKFIKTKLNNVLKTELEFTMHNDEDTLEKLDRVNTIQNIKKVIDNYDELEPLLKEFFSKKADKEK